FPGTLAIWPAVNRQLSELDGFFVFVLDVTKPRATREHLGVLGIELRSEIGGGNRSLDPAGITAVQLKLHAADVSDSGVRQSKTRIEANGVLKHLRGEFEIFTAQVAAPPQKIVVRLKVLRGFLRNRLFFLRGERNPKRLRDAACDLVLNFE